MSEASTSQRDGVTKRRYRKPPVIEVMVDLRFHGMDEPWEWDRVFSILDGLIPQGSPVETLVEYSIAHKETGKSDRKIAENMLMMRRFSQDGSHCVQIGRDRLVINGIKVAEQVPRFRTICPLVQEYSKRLSEILNVSMVDECTLAYLDEVSLPKSNDGVNLSDYFQIHPQFPDSFGAVSDFSIRGRWEVEKFLIRVDARSTDPFVFRFGWDATARFAPASHIDDVVVRLSEAKTLLRRLFEESFTDLCHRLFDPEA